MIFTQLELVYNTHINTIYEDRQKRLWLGTYKNGILLYKPDKQEIVHISSSLFNNLDVRCFYEDQNGKMWLGLKPESIPVQMKYS